MLLMSMENSMFLFFRPCAIGICRNVGFIASLVTYFVFIFASVIDSLLSKHFVWNYVAPWPALYSLTVGHHLPRQARHHCAGAGQGQQGGHRGPSH